LDRGPVLYEESDGQETPGTAEVEFSDDDTQTDDSNGTAAVALAAAAIIDIGAPSLRLEIRTTGPCWVSAVADGERAVYRLMQAGERAQVEAHNVIALRIGDAGALAYTVNGAPGRPLGRSGEAVTIRMTIDSLESLYAEPASGFPAGGADDSTGHRRDLEQQRTTDDRRVSASEAHARRLFSPESLHNPTPIRRARVGRGTRRSWVNDGLRLAEALSRPQIVETGTAK
jgi:hypothetical protein